MNKEKTKYSFILLISLLLIPVSVSANVVWPSVYIAEGMRSFYVILAGLVIETVFVKLFLKESLLKSVLIAFIMNLISSVVGFIVIPASGLIGEILLIPFDKGTFHISHWIMSYILAILSNVLIEGLSIKYIYKCSFKKMFWWLCVANAISIVICILFHGFLMQNVNI